MDELAACARALNRYFSARVRDPWAAEDLVQETYLRAYRSVSRGYAPESPRPWLYAIARRTLATFLRRRRPFEQLSEDPCAPAEPPALMEEREAVSCALRSLPPADAGLLADLYLRGVPFPDAAAARAVSRGALKVRAHRARRKLAAALADAAF